MHVFFANEMPTHCLVLTNTFLLSFHSLADTLRNRFAPVCSTEADCSGSPWYALLSPQLGILPGRSD